MLDVLEIILGQSFVKALVTHVLGEDFEVIRRPAAFILKLKDGVEDERNINRLIILPPKGYTSNKPNQTNCFHAVESAKIEIKGTVRKGTRGFSKVKNCLLVTSFDNQGAVSHLDKPYLEFDRNDPNSIFAYQERSSGEAPFYVVKSDGTGFYHSLTNLTDEWLVLQLHKVMRPQKKVDLEQHLSMLQDEQASILRKLYKEIIAYGDMLFREDKTLVNAVMRMPPPNVLPALCEMLYTPDVGKHEPCTAFAMILKMGRAYPKQTVDILKERLEQKGLPSYFAEQLISKIVCMQEGRVLQEGVRAKFKSKQ
ncbi:MAG: hypothetical protein H6853_04180 [Rhodospirillales bacterium]|nr:hypothetical protein [Alphaproteobacteria bacterium]USO04473.1 MAG: hypothetical protein H6853_04180 [Rhodospirillales bacterium]